MPDRDKTLAPGCLPPSSSASWPQLPITSSSTGEVFHLPDLPQTTYIIRSICTVIDFRLTPPKPKGSRHGNGQLRRAWCRGRRLSSHSVDTYLMPVELQWQLPIYDISPIDSHRERESKEEGVYFNAGVRPHLEENLPGNFVRFLRSERNLWNYFNLHYRVYEPD